jgi:hypothetical protein
MDTADSSKILVHIYKTTVNSQLCGIQESIILIHLNFQRKLVIFIKLYKNKFVICIYSLAMWYFHSRHDQHYLLSSLTQVPLQCRLVEPVIALHYSMYPKSFIHPPAVFLRMTPTQELKHKHVFKSKLGFCKCSFMQPAHTIPHKCWILDSLLYWLHMPEHSILNVRCCENSSSYYVVLQGHQIV